MSKVKLTGESSGYVEISAGTAAGNNTLELPTSGNKIISNNYVGVVTASTFSGDFSGDVTVATGATISGSTDTIIASTNGSERLRITSSGDVGIGTDIPVASVGYSNLSLANNSGGQIELKRLSSGPNTHYIWGDNHLNIAASYSGTSGDIVFKANGNNERFRVGANGGAYIANGNLVFSTSGTGIDFSATADGGNGSTMNSELLDDYEEGTWTPDLRFAGSNTGVSYAWRNGHYTKIGRQVTVRGAFGLSSRGTFNATDDAFIYGLPFDVAPYEITGGFNYTFGSAYNGYQGLFQIETQYSASFSDHVPLSRQTAWNSAVSPMEYQDIGGSQRMAFIFSYFTAS